MKAAIREQEFDVVTLRGTVSVGYFREDGQWFAVAREFDLLGSGDTREEALRELKGVVEDYVEACVFEGAAEFEKPSPDEEWDRTSERQSFVLLLIFARRSGRERAPGRSVSPRNFRRLRRYRRRFVGADLAGVDNAL